MAEKPDEAPEVVTPTDALQRAQRRAAQEELESGPQEKRDELQPGQGFLVDGQLVNADGEPVQKDKK